MEDNKFYTTKDIHIITGVNLRTVQEWAKEKRIPGATKFGHVWKFNKKIIKRALQKETFLIKA